MPFQKGHKAFPGVEKGWFKKGYSPPHKGTKGVLKSNKTSFKKGCKKSKNWYKAMSNRTPWNKGLKYKNKPCSDETKKKISKANTGKPCSEETKKKLSELNSGDKHPNWRGGVYKENDDMRHSAELKVWRTKVYERDNYTCQKCGKKKMRLNAHHIKPFSTHKDLRFDIDNGVTLCEICHIKEDTNRGKGRWKNK